ncbi:T9SS type B sorting domain-containing protein [Tamlana crocina]
MISFKSFCQNTAIPDPNFEQALIDLGYDSPPINGQIPTANISIITDLDLVSKNILDLTGIEDFIALTNLDCSDNALTLLDVSQNSNITELYCSDNLLTAINIENTPNLQRLWCFNNQLTNLDITQNSELISLRSENNLLTDLDVTNNTKLNVLVCEGNQISTLNVSNNTGLSRLQCGNNFIANLNIENNINLTYLSCDQNRISNLNLQNNIRLGVLICYENSISVLDLSNNTNLTDLNCSNNLLCNLNLKNSNNSNMNSVYFSGNQDLNCVIVDNLNDDRTDWMPDTFNNYAQNINDCNGFVPVDELDDVIGTGYTLPNLVNGSYFTGQNGTGTTLNAGDIISTSQTIYIYDETACFSNESSFFVLITENEYYIPKYFTPNGDGFHDVWKVIDNTNLINNITIYDRYGKLLKFLPSNANGWDGTYNGKLLPTDSYWYVIVLNNRNVLKGHFALKR